MTVIFSSLRIQDVPGQRVLNEHSNGLLRRKWTTETNGFYRMFSKLFISYS